MSWSRRAITLLRGERRAHAQTGPRTTEQRCGRVTAMGDRGAMASGRPSAWWLTRGPSPHPACPARTTVPPTPTACEPAAHSYARLQNPGGGEGPAARFRDLHARWTSTWTQPLPPTVAVTDRRPHHSATLIRLLALRPSGYGQNRSRQARHT